MTIWLISLSLNLFLCLLLLFRGHFSKYKTLFLWLTFELFAAPALHSMYTVYGTHSLAYANAFHIKNFLTILFSLGIIWEGFLWQNRCVRIPCEFYLLSLLIKFVAEKLQFMATSHLIYEVTRYSGIAIMAFYIFCFRGEARREKRTFRTKT